MSYPPQPPPPGPPGWGPPQGPPPTPPPGWGPPPGPPYDGRPKRNVGLVVAIVAVLVLLVGGIATTAVLLATGDDDGDRKAGDPDSSATNSPSDPSASSATAEPAPVTPEGSESAEGPATSGSPSGPITPYAPTDDTGDDIHVEVKASDFPGDWNFKLGDVEEKAKLRRTYDHASCGPVEASSALTQQRCEYAVQWNFSALGGKARVVHLFLVFDTQPHAKAAEARLENKDFDLPSGSIDDTFAVGQWRTSVYGNVVAVTIGTSREKISEKRLQSLVGYMNTDYRVALTFQSGL